MIRSVEGPVGWPRSVAVVLCRFVARAAAGYLLLTLFQPALTTAHLLPYTQRRADHFGLLGIVIRMFYKEHEPAHFHAEHQGQQAKFDLDGKPVAGQIRSRTALRLIREWTVLDRAALEANWAKMKSGKPLDRIPPLE